MKNQNWNLMMLNETRTHHIPHFISVWNEIVSDSYYACNEWEFTFIYYCDFFFIFHSIRIEMTDCLAIGCEKSNENDNNNNKWYKQ